MKTMVIYKSKTGFTRKYAEWIADDLKCDLRELSGVDAPEIAKYDLIVFGGWIMGGMINGLNKVKEYCPKKMVVFGVGFTARNEMDMNKLAEINKLEGTPLYYFEGGMHPEKMGFMGRTMVKMATKKKPVYTDNTKREYTSELIEAVRL